MMSSHNPSKNNTDIEIEDVDDNNGKEKMEVYEPPRDVFTLMFVSPVSSFSFFYGFSVFIVQLFILIVIIVDLLSESENGNILAVPVMVTSAVKAGQFMALTATVIAASEIKDSFDFFLIPYNKDVEKKFPHASRLKHRLSFTLRLMEGCVSSFITFIFIVQSEDNLNLFLNFVAVQFVSELDNLAFELANHGYGAKSMKIVTRQIEDELKFNYPSKKWKRYNRHNYVIGGFYLLLIASWIVVMFNQDTGVYFKAECQEFDVRFGSYFYDFFGDVCRVSGGCKPTWEARSRKIPYANFNDIYSAQSHDNQRLVLKNSRPMYNQRNKIEFDSFGQDSPPGKFWYCEQEEAWVFTIEGIHKGKNGADDPCNWLMKSPKTNEYIFRKVPRNGWSIWTGTIEISTEFSFSCVECANSMECNYNGQCSEEKCQCDPHWMGSTCKTCAACTEYTMHDQSDNSMKVTLSRLDGPDVNRSFETKPFNLYSRPVYYRTQNINGTMVPDPRTQILFYDGCRFVFWEAMNTRSEESIQDLEILKQYLSNFHSLWDLNNGNLPMFVSEVTMQTTPFNLTWTNVETGEENVHFEFECPEADKKSCLFLFNDMINP